MRVPSAVAGTGGSFAFIGSVCHKVILQPVLKNVRELCSSVMSYQDSSVDGAEKLEKSVSIVFGKRAGHALPAGGYLGELTPCLVDSQVLDDWKMYPQTMVL